MGIRILFLFGAGASAYSGDCRPNAPPMGDNLFKRMNAEGFIRQRLASEGEELFRKPRGFELGMAWLNARPSTERVPFLRGMGAFFARYYPGNRNGYVRLFSGSKLKKPNIGLQL